MLHLLTQIPFAALDSSCSNKIYGAVGPGLYDNLCSNGQPQLGALGDISHLILNLIAIILWLAGSLAIIFIIVGAIFYIISAGDPSRLKRAKDILTNVVVGLVVIFLAYALVQFISNGLS